MSNAPCTRPDGNGQGVMLPAAESRVGGQGPRQFSSGEFRWYSKAGESSVEEKHTMKLFDA